MVTQEVENTTSEFTAEERKLLAETLELMDARELELAIARARRTKPDKSGVHRRIGRNVAALVQQLRFWEGDGQLEDDVIHKADREIYAEVAQTRDALLTSREVARSEGLLEFGYVYRPSDGRRVMGYRLNLWNTLTVGFRSEIGLVEDVVEHERRPKYKARLVEKLDKLRLALDDLELRFAEPDFPDFPEDEADFPNPDDFKEVFVDDPDDEYDGKVECSLCGKITCDGCDDDTYPDFEEEEADLNLRSNVWNSHTLNYGTPAPSTTELPHTTEQHCTTALQNKPLLQSERTPQKRRRSSRIPKRLKYPARPRSLLPEPRHAQVRLMRKNRPILSARVRRYSWLRPKRSPPPVGGSGCSKTRCCGVSGRSPRAKKTRRWRDGGYCV